MNNKVLIDRGLLERVLGCMEADWMKIDQEWGPSELGLDGEVAQGLYPEIAELRELLATPAPIPDADHIDDVRAMVVPDGWLLELIGPDEVLKLSRKDGKWCGITHLSDSPRDGLLYPFLRAMLAASPAPGDK